MRLLELAVHHFGPVKKASLTFGPGLNVLYGPNDLGKSHLAEAIRAVLLLPPSSSEHKNYLSWGTDETPAVSLTFQLEDQRFRVRKTFGAGARGTAVLERARGQGDSAREATARQVDGRLRELLAWGVAAPGGKSGPRGLPKTYLSTVLLGRQSEVASVLQRSLEQDPDGSAKERLTRALAAFAQPEQFRRVLQASQAQVDLAFDSRGLPRRARGSPFMGVREEVKVAEERLAELEQQVSGTEAVRQQLEALLNQRDELALKLDDARARQRLVREACDRASAIRAAEEALGQARRDLEQIEATQADVARRAAEVEALRDRVTAAEGELERAQGEVQAAERAVRAAEEALRTVTAERADAVLLKKQTLETRRVQLEAALTETSRRAEAARAAGVLVNQAQNAERRVAQALAEVERLERRATRSEVELRLATVPIDPLVQPGRRRFNICPVAPITT
ncbi:MAG: AAA family ATPase [Planctomycetes bacterium]|nr:AAA family ATPase [Planctomycetota bacterium]